MQIYYSSLSLNVEVGVEEKKMPKSPSPNTEDIVSSDSGIILFFLGGGLDFVLNEMLYMKFAFSNSVL